MLKLFTTRLLPALAMGLLATATAAAQSVGIGTTTPNAAAALDITTTGKGLLIPRMDSASRVAIATPPDGLMVFQNDGRKGFWYAIGGTWLYIPDKTRSGDNLGNHLATQNLNLAGNKLVGGTAAAPGTSGLFVNGSGFAGIGTTSPNRPLTLQPPAGSGELLSLRDNTGTGKWHFNLNGNGLNLAESGVADNRLFLQPGGNVGIGTASPGAKLDVAGNARATELVATNSVYVDYAETNNGAFAGQNALKFGPGATGEGIASRRSTGIGQFGLDFYTGYSSRLTILNNGNVGIGTANAVSRLSLGGGVFPNQAKGRIALFEDIPGSSFYGLGLVLTPSSHYGIGIWGGSGNQLPYDGTTGALPSLFLDQPTGNVGVGVLDPTATLDVAGSARVRGLTTAGVVTTDANGNLSSVASSTLADNLGNHLATQALNLQGNALTGTGDNLFGVGVGVRANGGLNLGQQTANVLLGYNTGTALTTGNNNVFTGRDAGAATTTGVANVFTGNNAGTANVSGSGNAFVGHNAGKMNVGGELNVFAGADAGRDNTSGSRNTLTGAQTGSLNQGDDNTFVGNAAGSNNITGSRNVALGQDSGPSTAGLTNAIALGAKARVSQSNSLVLGGLGANAVQVGIGTTAPAATFHVAGGSSTVRLDGLAGTAGRYVTVAADGTLGSITAPTAVGDNLGNGIATTDVNVGGFALTGSGASIGTTVGVGVRADGGLNLGQNTVGNSVYLGYQAGAANTSGIQNTFSGYQAGKATTNSYNTFTGYLAGTSNTSGFDNTFYGNASGQRTTTGARNTFAGGLSGQYNTLGTRNTLMGYSSGGATTTGANNTFVGYSGGSENVTGTSNTALGYNSGPAAGSPDLTNSTALGNNARVSQNNSLVLGGTGADAVSVGIGTAAPAATLHVAGAASTVRLEGLAGTPGRVVTLAADGTLGSTATSTLGDNLGNHSATTDLALNNNNLLLRLPNDTYHALRYNSTYNGPLLYGSGGGALGYTSDGSTVTPALRWTSNNNVSVGLAGTNAGTGPDLSFGGAGYGEGIGSARATGSSNLYGLDLYTSSVKRLTISNGGTVSVGVAGTNTGTAPDLAFGGNGTGEGMGSARSSGNPNQYGLDFYTGFNKRLSIANGGNVGIGTTAPSSTLQVQGSFAVGVVSGLVGSPSPGLALDKAGYYGLAPSGANTYYRLPDPSTCPGRLYYLRNNTGATTATLTTAGGLLFDGGGINGVGTYGMDGTGSSKTVTAVSDGTNWTIIRGGN